MPSIGTVTFRTTNDGKLNILSSSMENGYESLEKQAIKQVIDMYPDYDISWANTGSKQAIYDELVEENPRGQEAGLNYRERYDDADTAYVLRWLGNHFSQSDAENRVMAILLQHAAGRMGLTGEQFITKYSSDIRTIGEEEAKMIRAMGKDPDSVKGFTLSLKEEARAVIYAGKKADVTTFQHELNHVLMGIGENKADFEKAFHQALSTDPERLSMFIEQNIDVIPSATKNGKYDPNFLSTLYNREENDDRDWTRLEEEFEDQLWEAYHRKGDTLNPELKGFFRRIAESFRRIYKALRNSNGIELNAELRDYFDRLYGFDKDGVDKGRDFSSWEYKRNMSLAQEEYNDVASLSPDDQYAYIRDKYVGSEAYMRAPNGKPSNLTEDQWITVRTPAFKGWFGDWENDPENASKVVDENGEPREVYHGTYGGEFDVFDIAKGSFESDMGRGFYFTSNYYDMSNNYEEGGPDFEMKVERLSDDLMTNDEDLDSDEARKQAREILFVGGSSFDVFLNMRNPAYVDSTRLFEFESSLDMDDFVDEDEYYDAVNEEIDQKIAEAIDNAISKAQDEGIDFDEDELREILVGIAYEGGSGIAEVKERLLMDSSADNGDFADNELLRCVIEACGFDGIIDSTVSDKFVNMNIEEGTSHFIAFKPNQIKSATDNSGAFSSENNSILFQDADYDGTVAITADVRKEFERAKEAIPAESNWHDVLFQLKSVTSNVQTSYKGRRDVTYAVSMQPEVYEKFRNKEWKEADFEIESFEQARFINTNEERLKDWQQLYADRMAAKWTVHKRNGTLETKNITFGRMKKNAKKGKVESIPCVDLTIGCQRIRTVIERIKNGIMPADTPIESCYGGTCFVNLDQAHKLYGSENVDTKDLVMVTPDDIRRWFSLNTTRKFLQRDTGFIRMGFRGDCAHSFPILDGYNTSLAETWLQCITDYEIRNPKTGELMKTVFITAGYAPTTEESYARLVPYKDLCEIHVSTSGWFSKNELMLRLAEFDVMNKLGLNVSLRVVTDRNSISDSPFNNTNWLKDMIFNVMKVPQTQLLGTAYHNDRSMKHSLFDQDFVNQCCVTGKCISCNVGCMVRNKNSATSKFLAPYGTEFVTEDSYLHKNETKPASFEFEAEEDVFEDNDYLETSRDDESTAAEQTDNVLFQEADEYNPSKTRTGYKLFDMEISTGKLYPLFIGSKKETPVGKWLIAENIPTKGFARRPGWHIGSTTPDAPWLKNASGEYSSSRGKKFTRVYAEVEFPAEVDYQPLADASPTKDLPNTIPLDGYYMFDERKRGTWVIAGALRVNRVLDWDEVDAILKAQNYDAEAAFAPYRAGFEKRAQTLAAKKAQQTILMQSDEGDTKAEIDNGTLYISHSISTQNLQKALQMGGFPMPSLAITRPDLSYKTEAYGDVVLIGGWDMAKENLERGSVYDRDLWSPMYPEPKYDSDIKGLADYVTSLNSKYPELKAGGISETEFKANNATDRSAAASRLSYHPTVAMEYLNEAAIEHPSNIDWDGMKEIIHATADSYKAYRNWIEGKLANFYSDPFVTVNGEKKPYTLENILSNMQSGRLIGNKFDHQLNKNTTGNLFALTAKSFGSREEMRQAEPLLDKADPLSVFSNDMNNLAYALQGNGFEFKDYNTALDSVREYLNANAEGIDAMKDILPGEMKINDIVNAAYQLAEAFKTKQASQGFFEAKPGRIVALSEFRVAVVPESISADLYDALAANGLQIVMYNAADNYNGREEAIADLVETQKDILFQESPKDLWLADIAELANTCTTYEQFRAVVDAFAMGEPTENAEADMRKAFDNRSTEEKKTTEPVFEEAENIDFDFDWDSIKVEYYDYDPEPGYDIYDDETEDFIITSWSIAHEEDKTTIYKPNARHLSKDEKIDDFLTLLDDDSQLVAYLNALREANRIVKYGNERDLDFDPKAEADRYKRLMESADIIQQRIAPFIRNIVLGKAAKDGSLDTGRIKGLSDKAKSIVRGIIEKNAAEYIDLFYRATGIDYWNVKAASESDIDAQAAKIAAEKGLSFAEERQIAADIGDKIIEEKIIKGATVSNQEVRNLVRRNRDRAMLAEQEHQIAEQMLKDRLVVENGKIKQLTIEAQQAQEAISKVETALDEINEKINKTAARISKIANKKGVKDQDDQIVKLIQDKKALEQKKNYLERLKAQRTNYNLKLFNEGKMFSEAGLKKIAEIEAEIAKTIDKISELEKQQVISEDEAIDAIIRLTKGIEREKASKDLYDALTLERWKGAKKLQEAKKKADIKLRDALYVERLKASKEKAAEKSKHEADILAQRMHDAIVYGKLYGRQIERLEKANLALKTAKKQERQARRLKAEMERLARQIMKKPSANVDLDEAEQIIQIQQALYPAFQSRMRVDGATYKVEDLRTLIKDPNSPILTLLSPDQLARLTKTSLDQMTLGELKAIAQAVRDLREKGLAKRRQYLIEQRQKAANIQYLLINQLMQSDKYKEPEVRGSLNESEREKKDRWNSIYLSTYNMARKAQMLDGNSKGVFYDLLIRRKRDRQDVQNRGIISRQAPVFAVLQEQGLGLDDLYESIEVVIDGKTATFSLSQLAYVYLSINNEKNRAAVAYGNLITEAERLSIKKGVEARIIGGSDMADVRREAYNEELRIIGDRRYQELWEQAEEALNARPEKLAVFKAMEASLNSDRFDEVVALMRREFNEDIAREGYYLPINRSGIVGESPAEKLKADILNAVPGTRASVNKGMTMQRITISPHHQTSVDLDLVKAWGDSIYDQEHLLAFLEYTRLLDRIFENAFGENTRMLRETIESSYGPAMMREIDTYLKEVANPSAGKIADDMKRAGKLLKAMRGNMYAATFGFRVSSIINQAITSPAPFLGAVRADEYARAALRFMAHPNEMWEYVCERSSFMANRDMDVAQGIIRDAKESEGQSEFKKKYYSALEVSMLGMQYIDRYTVAIGWLAIYDKELQRLGGETPENIRHAVKKADEYVQETQPQSDVTELSPIVKSDSWSLIAPFQSALNTVWQNVTYDIPTAFKNGRYAEAIGTIVGYMIGGIMLALVHGDLVPDEDDEKKGWSIARRIFNAGISQFVEGAPLMGDTISSILKMVITGEKDFYYGSNDIPLASSLISVSTSAYDKKWLKALESLVYGTAQYFGAPISEIKDIKRAFEEEDWKAIIGWRN